MYCDQATDSSHRCPGNVVILPRMSTSAPTWRSQTVTAWKGHHAEATKPDTLGIFGADYGQIYYDLLLDARESRDKKRKTLCPVSKSTHHVSVCFCDVLWPEI